MNHSNFRSHIPHSHDKYNHYEDLLPTVNKYNFDKVALSLFSLQAEDNHIYRHYLSCLGVCTADVQTIEDIPFLPISFYKTHDIISGDWEAEKKFLSSGTTGDILGKHSIKSMSFYRTVTQVIFQSFYGALNDYHFLILAPPHSGNETSSLITMLDYFVRESNSPYSSFYLQDLNSLCDVLEVLKKDSKKIILWGLSFALMDLAKEKMLDLSHCIVMETGGMKGKKKEITREEFHRFLCHRFNLSDIHSEYGMTELLSQAYSCGKGYFRSPPWMKVLVRDINDPFDVSRTNKTGSINIIDLANIYTCAFIETQDLGKVGSGEYFEVLGRVDNTDMRGCNNMLD